MNFKPLLAAPVDFDQIDYGNTWLSAKLDGIRAIVINGVVMSRSLKPIPNQWVQECFGRPELEGVDGELICGSPTSPTVYHDTYSAVMSKDNRLNVHFYVFDHIAEPTAVYQRRYQMVKDAAAKHDNCFVVLQHAVHSHADLVDLEEWHLQKGYEGVMLRTVQGPNSMYKYGRSTAKAGTLLKLKRFTDAEAEVIGFEEEMSNNNEATTNALGRTQRSTHAENKVGKGRLGAFICRTAEGVEFNIGTGFTAKQREDLWGVREALVSLQVKYKSFKIGEKDAPRFPVFLGWRHPLDM